MRLCSDRQPGQPQGSMTRDLSSVAMVPIPRGVAEWQLSQFRYISTTSQKEIDCDFTGGVQLYWQDSYEKFLP